MRDTDALLAQLIARLDELLARAGELLPAAAPLPEFAGNIAFRWRRPHGEKYAGRHGGGRLVAVSHLHQIRLADLQDIDMQKSRIDANTRQFLRGRLANNVLLTGARGTGKSSLVKALLNEYAGDGLRLIEVDKDDLIDLPDIVELIAGRPERFILFCDDMSFESGEPGYKALKSVLDGSVSAMADNILIYATSNRRHLMPEYFDENLDARHVGGEVHPGEATEEKISLSERFGLWLSFYPFTQDEYLEIVYHWLRRFGVPAVELDAARGEALQWSLMRGSRSGRVAWQFARDYAGRNTN